MSKRAQIGHLELGFGRTRLRSQRGLTLVEVMTATVISAILLGVAAPSFSDVMSTARVRSEALELWALLNRARAEAIRRNVPVLVCPSNDGTSCLSPPVTHSWSGTKIACYDADSNGECDAPTPDAANPIRVRNAADASVQLIGPASSVRFNGHGTAAGSVNFTLTTAVGGSKSSTVAVAAMGAVRVD